MNPSFLRFIRCMRMDLTSDELQWVFVTLFELVKTKIEALIKHDGEIKGRESNHFANKMVVCRHLWTWHLSTFHSFNWVFNLSLNWSTFMSHATPLIHVHCRILFHLVNSMLPSLRSCRLMFKREIVLRIYTCSQNNILCQLLLRQSYGYIIFKIPKHCSEFHVIDVGFIMALLRRDYSYQHQLII